MYEEKKGILQACLGCWGAFKTDFRGMESAQGSGLTAMPGLSSVSEFALIKRLTYYPDISDCGVPGMSALILAHPKANICGYYKDYPTCKALGAQTTETLTRSIQQGR